MHWSTVRRGLQSLCGVGCQCNSEKCEPRRTLKTHRRCSELKSRGFCPWGLGNYAFSAIRSLKGSILECSKPESEDVASFAPASQGRHLQKVFDILKLPSLGMHVFRSSRPNHLSPPGFRLWMYCESGCTVSPGVLLRSLSSLQMKIC